MQQSQVHSCRSINMSTAKTTSNCLADTKQTLSYKWVHCMLTLMHVVESIQGNDSPWNRDNWFSQELLQTSGKRIHVIRVSEWVSEVPELGFFVESLNWGKSTPWLGGSFTGTRTGLDIFQKIGSSFGYSLGFRVGSWLVHHHSLPQLLVFGVVQLASNFFKLASCSQAHKTHIIHRLNGSKLRVKWSTILVQRSFLLHAHKLTKLECS